MENALLVKDGPAASSQFSTSSPCRYLSFDIASGEPTGDEYIAFADATSVYPDPSTGFSVVVLPKLSPWTTMELTFWS
jgi:hypothetical protein